MATQFDILRRQAEAAGRSAVDRAQSGLRRDTSLVNQASRWAGRTMTEGEAALRRRAGGGRRRSAPPGEHTAERPRPVRPAPDGYVRRSPVQPLRVAEGYRRRQAQRAAAAVALIVAAGLCIYFLNRLGVFGR